MSAYAFCPPVEYTLKVSYSRFSSAYGYGYTMTSKIVRYDPYFDEKEITSIKSVRLHCTIGESPTMYPKSDIVIKPETLHAIQNFCEKIGNFWGGTFEKKLDYNGYNRLWHVATDKK